MDEIRQELSDKHFDERTLQLISNAIQEFDDLFGKIVPRDEVIRRIKENIDEVVFEHQYDDKSTKGKYFPEEKKIYLADTNDEEQLKSTLFHEIVHCITTDREKNTVGFSRTLDVENSDETRVVMCHGLTEGFAQYVTKIRDKKYAPNLKKISYPILSEQVGNLAELIGEDKFLDIGFNRPNDLSQELGLIDEYGNDIDAEEFYEAFDVIWVKEKDIYREKLFYESQYGNLINDIFDVEDTDSKGLKYAKSLIVKTLNKILLSRPVTTVEEFNSAYLTICKYAKQLNMQKDASLFRNLLAQIENLQDSGKSMEEILKDMPRDAQSLVKGNQITQEFLGLSKDEKIELLSQPEFLVRLSDEDIFDSPFLKTFLSQMAGSVIKTDSQDRDNELFWQLTDGLAKIIKERGYNVDTLSLEYIDFKRTEGVILFNLYSNNLDESIYLGTFMDEDTELLEFTPHGNEKEKIKAEYPELTDAVILTAGEGQIVAYNGNNEYSVIRCGEKIESIGITYCSSELERLQEGLSRRRKSLQHFVDLGAPEIIIADKKRLIQQSIKEIQQIQNKSKILPEEIEVATGNISLEEMKEIMGDITHTKETRQDALERGIGYGKE